MKRAWMILLFVAVWGQTQEFSLPEALGETWISGAQGWELFVSIPLGDDLLEASEPTEGWKALSWSYPRGAFNLEGAQVGTDPAQTDHIYLAQALPIRLIGDWRKQFQVLETGEIITKDYSIGWIHPEDGVESGVFFMTYTGNSDRSRALIILVESLDVLEKRDALAQIMDQFID
jgi:hypothetical protein